MGRCLSVLAIMILLMVVCSKYAFGASISKTHNDTNTKMLNKTGSGDLFHHGASTEDNSNKNLAHGNGGRGGGYGGTTSIKDVIHSVHGLPKFRAAGAKITDSPIGGQVSDAADASYGTVGDIFGVVVGVVGDVGGVVSGLGNDVANLLDDILGSN